MITIGKTEIERSIRVSDDPGRTRDDPGRTRDFRERLEVGAMLLEFGTDPLRNRPCRCRYATLHPPRIIVLARPDKTGRAATESIDRPESLTID